MKKLLLILPVFIVFNVNAMKSIKNSDLKKFITAQDQNSSTSSAEDHQKPNEKVKRKKDFEALKEQRINQARWNGGLGGVSTYTLGRCGYSYNFHLFTFLGSAIGLYNTRTVVRSCYPESKAKTKNEKGWEEINNAAVTTLGGLSLADVLISHFW